MVLPMALHIILEVGPKGAEGAHELLAVRVQMELEGNDVVGRVGAGAARHCAGRVVGLRKRCRTVGGGRTGAVEILANTKLY